MIRERIVTFSRFFFGHSNRVLGAFYDVRNEDLSAQLKIGGSNEQ